MAIRILRIRKPNDFNNSFDAISHYGWTNEQNGESGITDRKTMIQWVESGGHAYVSSQEGTVNCFINESTIGTRFLQTNADNRSSNNLLNLPRC